MAERYIDTIKQNNIDYEIGVTRDVVYGPGNGESAMDSNRVAHLSTVAVTGDYTDLANKVLLLGDCPILITKGLTIIPNAYMPVEYLICDGDQYVNTGIPVHMNYKYLFSFKQADNGNYRVWGQFNLTTYNGGFNASMTYAGGFALRWTTTGTTTDMVQLSSATDALKHEILIENGEVFFDNISHGTSVGHRSSSVGLYNSFYGTINPGGSTPTTSLKGNLYEYYVWDNTDTLIQHLVPCYRKADNIPGFYDTIAGSFLLNIGTGQFGIGGDVANTFTIGFDPTCIYPDFDDRYVTLHTNQTIDGIKTLRGQNILRAPLVEGRTDTTVLGATADNAVIGFRFQNERPASAGGDKYLGKFTANNNGDIGFYSNNKMYFRPAGGDSGSVNVNYGITMDSTGMYPGSALSIGTVSYPWGYGYINYLNGVTATLSGLTTNRLIVSNSNKQTTSLAAGTSGQYLKSNGSGLLPTWSDLPSPPTIGTLNTTSTTSVATSASESFSDNISLHKVSKTGSYEDLLDKPYIPDVPDNITTWGTTSEDSIVVGDGDKVKKTSYTIVTSIPDQSTSTKIPNYDTVVSAINNALTSSLTYKGTVSTYPNPSTKKIGDVYIASTSFTYDSKKYEAGDMFIWNGTTWDVVSGENLVSDKNVTLEWNTLKTIATVDGTDIHVTLPENPGTNHVPYGGVLLPTNPFGGNQLYINSLDNPFASADKKYWVVITKHNVTVDGVTYPRVKEGAVKSDDVYWEDSPVISTLTSSAHNIFNGTYEDSINVANDQYLKIHIQFAPITDSWKPSTAAKGFPGCFPGYPYGTFYLSYYYYNTPKQSSKLRIYKRALSSSDVNEWKLFTASDFKGTRSSGAYIEQITETNCYYRSCLEFIIYGNTRTVGSSSYNTSLTLLEEKLTRPNLAETGSTVTKYGSLSLYLDFSWYKHINSAVAVKAIWTDIENLTIGLNGLTANKLVKTNSSKKLTTASVNTYTVPSSVTIGTSTGIISITPSTASFVTGYDNYSTSNFVTGYTPSSATVLTSVAVKGALTSLTPTTSKLTTTTITAVGGTVTASAASAGTAKTLLTSISPSTASIIGISGVVTASKATASTGFAVITKINPNTSTIYGVSSSTVTASKASTAVALSATVISTVTPVTAITSSTYTSSSCTLSLGSGLLNTVATKALSIPLYSFTNVDVPVKNSMSNTIVSGFNAASTATVTPYTFTDVNVPVAGSSVTVVTGFGTDGTTTITPYTFTTVTAATPASAGTVVATGDASASSSGITVVTNVTGSGTSTNLTVTPSTANVIASMGTASTSVAITSLGAASINTGITSLGTPSTAQIVTSVTTATTTINNWS